MTEVGFTTVFIKEGLKVTLVAVIGGFDPICITRKTDGNFGNVSRVFCFPKSRINENDGNHLN